jgi:hypothetical protein
VASDAFFPFADGLLTAAEAGATAIIQPGGSMRDDEVIAAAMRRGWPWSSPASGISGTDMRVLRPYLAAAIFVLDQAPMVWSSGGWT